MPATIGKAMKMAASFRFRESLPRLALVCLAVFTGISASADVVCTFDCNDGDWRIVDLDDAQLALTNDVNRIGAPIPVDFSESGGNAGGCVVFQDRSSYVFYFQAPPSFLGNRSTSYGNFLTYDQFVHAANNTLSGFPDVIIVGAGRVLVFTNSFRPGSEWTPFGVLLTEANGWRKGALTGAPPTQIEFQAVLSSLTRILIRGEYSPTVGDETTGLDNVVIRADPPRIPAAAWIKPPPQSVVAGETFTVSWSFVGAPTHMNVHWDPSNPTTITNVLAGSARDASAVTNVAGQQLAAPTNNANGTSITNPITVLYAVHVANSLGESYSSIAPVTVNPPVLPTVAWTVPPPNVVTAGQSFVVSWAYTGNPDHVNVHWHPSSPTNFASVVEGSTADASESVVGATSAILTAPVIHTNGLPITNSTTVKYAVHVGNRAGVRYSTISSVTVNPPTAPTVAWEVAPPPTAKPGQVFQVSWRYTGFPSHVNIHWSPGDPMVGTGDAVLGSTFASSRVVPINQRTLAAPVIHTNGQPITAPTIVRYAVHVQNANGEQGYSAVAEVIVAPTNCAAQPAVITWLPSPNFGSRPVNQVIDSVVIHTTEGDYDSAISRLTDTSVPIDERVSAHYVIKFTGEIVELVDVTNRAWHATYFNDRSIGIEMVGFANQPSTWNSQNVAALENLVAWHATQFPIPIQHPVGDATSYPSCRYAEPGLVGHSQVQPDSCTGYSVKSDPGPHFPWTTFVDNVQAKTSCLSVSALEITSLPAGRIRLAWTTNAASVLLEATDALGANSCWSLVWPPPLVSGDKFTVTNEVVGWSKFYRLKTSP